MASNIFESHDVTPQRVIDRVDRVDDSLMRSMLSSELASIEVAVPDATEVDSPKSHKIGRER
jgi:hypothetical protein